jgi:hypothetical protein
VLVDQFLHGYSNGHRLLAGSRQPDEATGSALLSHSDAPVVSRTRILASLPLPEIRSWALTSIWPAEDAPRPGSVWSHTLLLDQRALSSLEGAAGLLDAFSKPSGRDEYSRYSEQLEIADSPLSIRAGDRGLVEAILLATYGWPGKSTAVLVTDLDLAAEVLLAVWQRQWPDLRAAFVFRTRQRLSEEARPGLEVAYQAARREGAARIEIDAAAASDRPNPIWLRVLTNDLESKGGSIQGFLWSFGPEAPKGWSDLPALARIYSEISNSKTGTKPVDALLRAYPEPKEMPYLKIAMLGPNSILRHATEQARIELSIAHAERLPWKQLELSERTLSLLEKGNFKAFADVLEVAAVANQGAGPGKEILGAVAQGAGLMQVLGLAERSPQTVARVLRFNPTPLEDPTFWSGSPPWLTLLLPELAALDVPVPPRPFMDEADDEVLLQALTLDLVTPLAVAEFLAEKGAKDRQLERWEALFNGKGGSGSKELVTNESSWQQVALAIAADPKPSRPLVRKHAHKMAEHFEDMDPEIRLRLAAAIFESSGARKIDKEATGRSFAILHRFSSKKENREKLLGFLPGLRVPQDELRVALRQKLVDVVREEEWDPEDIAVALYNAGPGSKKVRDLTPKKSDARKVFDAASKLVKDAVRVVRGR